jgi:hypothetical protein
MSLPVPAFWELYFLDDIDHTATTGGGGGGVKDWIPVIAAIREHLRTIHYGINGYSAYIDLCSHIQNLTIPLPMPYNDYIHLLKDRPNDTANCTALAIHQVHYK